MTEGEPSGLPRIIITTPQERVAAYSYAAAERYDLDPVTAEHLRGYANAQSRIRELRRDFLGTTNREVKYPGWTGGEANHRIKITRENYQRDMFALSFTAFSIYSEYLSKNKESQSAAREVDVFVNDALPRFDRV